MSFEVAYEFVVVQGQVPVLVKTVGTVSRLCFPIELLELLVESRVRLHQLHEPDVVIHLSGGVDGSVLGVRESDVVDTIFLRVDESLLNAFLTVKDHNLQDKSERYLATSWAWPPVK